MNTVPTSAEAPLVCWNCHERTLGTVFCSSCGKLLELPQGIDYFALFEMPRRLWVDMSSLEQKFLQLSWKLHPDNFVNASEQERELSLERSSELNDAYRTLREPVARVEYLLAIEGERKEGEKKQQALDELREAKASGADLAGLKARLEAAAKSFQEKLGDVDGKLQAAAHEWDAALGGERATRERIMGRLNELLNHRSYIRNLVANVAKELAEV